MCGSIPGLFCSNDLCPCLPIPQLYYPSFVISLRIRYSKSFNYFFLSKLCWLFQLLLFQRNLNQLGNINKIYCQNFLIVTNQFGRLIFLKIMSLLSLPFRSSPSLSKLVKGCQVQSTFQQTSTYYLFQYYCKWYFQKKKFNIQLLTFNLATLLTLLISFKRLLNSLGFST